MSDAGPTRAGHIRADGLAWRETDDGPRRKIRGRAPEMPMMRDLSDAGTEGPLHIRPHVRSSCIVSGLFEIIVGGVTERIGPRGGLLVEGSGPHAVAASSRAR